VVSAGRPDYRKMSRRSGRCYEPPAVSGWFITSASVPLAQTHIVRTTQYLKVLCRLYSGREVVVLAGDAQSPTLMFFKYRSTVAEFFLGLGKRLHVCSLPQVKLYTASWFGSCLVWRDSGIRGEMNVWRVGEPVPDTLTCSTIKASNLGPFLASYRPIT
jgi:hypothetical protein